MDIGLEKRQKVLGISLALEGLTSAYLSNLLGIEDYANSKTLGNNGSAISFSQKINLLMDIGALSKDNKTKFIIFMEIRNQFMHNLEATNYEKCFENEALKTREKFLLKTYDPPKDISREERLEKVTTDLGNDLGRITHVVIEKVKEKMMKESTDYVTAKSNKAFVEAIAEMKTSVDGFFDKEIEKGGNWNVKRLKGFGTGMSKIINGLWSKHFKILLNEKSDDKNEQ